MHYLKAIFSLAFVLFIASCRKDKVPVPVEEPVNTCAINPTGTSYTELDLSVVNSDLYTVNFSVPQNAQGMMLDFDCDGGADLQFSVSSSDSYNPPFHWEQSQFTLTPLNTRTYLLGDVKSDSTYIISIADTSGIYINNYQLTSSYFASGSALQQVNNTTYLTNFDSTQILFENDPRWTSSSLIGLRQYRLHQSFQYADANNYIHYIDDNQEFNRGIIPNGSLSWIPFKFITKSGEVKMGYLKVKPMLWWSSIDLKIEGWAIQR